MNGGLSEAAGLPCYGRPVPDPTKAPPEPVDRWRGWLHNVLGVPLGPRLEALAELAARLRANRRGDPREFVRLLGQFRATAARAGLHADQLPAAEREVIGCV
jgi:hypothetical protein